MLGLNDFIKLYGESDLLRTMEIKAPATEEIFINRLYEEIDTIIQKLEAGRKERFEDGEDRLSIEIVSCLNSAGYFSEKDPTHGGHVDFLVIPEKSRKFKWYGEAKIWDGVEYLYKGIDQLVSRYASGKEKNLGFFIYFKEENLVNKMKKWKLFLNKKPTVYAKKTKIINEFSFYSSHAHSAGSVIQIRHFSININWAPI